MKSKNEIMFKDIIGYEEEKKELKEIQKFFTNIELYKKHGVRIPKGVLLVGESGTGKTLMVRALANEINIPILSYGNEMTDDEEKIEDLRNIFAKAKDMAPCIIFIDELDKMKGSIPYDFDFGEGQSTAIRELVTLIDGYEDNSGVIVIATANNAYRMDQTLLRSGRFDRIINIKLPNQEERKQLFEYYSSNKKLEENIDFEQLSKRTQGLSCADIDNIMNDSALLSLRGNNEKISMKEIETSIDRIVLKSSNKVNLSKEEKKIIAVHEIGHAIIGIESGLKDEIDKVSIISRGNILGHTRFINTRPNDDTDINKKNLEDQALILLGSAAAEELFFNNLSGGASHDIVKAKRIVQHMVKRYGMCNIKYCVVTDMDDVISEKKMRTVEKVIDKKLDRLYKRSKKIVKKNKSKIKELSKQLINKNVLYKHEIEKILKI